VPAQGGEALVEHLAERAARAERELRQLRTATAEAERRRTALRRAARQLAEQPAMPVEDLVLRFLPDLGRWCAVDELSMGQGTRRLVTHDAALAREAAALDGPIALEGDAPIGVARVLQRGRIERLPSLPVLDDRTAGHGPLGRLATGPLLVVPLTTRGRVVAALTFGRTAEEPDYDDEAERFATDVASLAAIAL
jgi:hypothetical protein